MHLWKGMCRRHIPQNTPNSPSAEPDLGKEKEHLLPFSHLNAMTTGCLEILLF